MNGEKIASPSKTMGHSFRIQYLVPGARCYSVHKCKDPFIFMIMYNLPLIFSDSMVHFATRDSTHTTPRTVFEADFLDSGESAHAKRWVYGNIST